MSSERQVNLCRAVLTMPSETTRAKSVHLSFECCKNGFSVRKCTFYAPMRFQHGVFDGECEHFNNCQCTCGKARAAAQRWAEAILRNFLA